MLLSLLINPFLNFIVKLYFYLSLLIIYSYSIMYVLVMHVIVYIFTCTKNEFIILNNYIIVSLILHNFKNVSCFLLKVDVVFVELKLTNIYMVHLFTQKLLNYMYVYIVAIPLNLIFIHFIPYHPHIHHLHNC